MLSVSAIPALKDNYIWALRRDDRPEAAVVDPGEAEPVLRWLKAQGLTLGAILVTHHHWDHTHGIGELRARWPVPVHGPARERQPIEALSHPHDDGARLELECLDAGFEAMTIPGHTIGATAYYGHGLLFSGDTLFQAGCGRLFEGSAAQMHASLQRLARLPDETQLCCGHEYSEANLLFTLTVEPDNVRARQRLQQVRELRSRGEPSVPSRLGLERDINPFLRCDLPAVRAAAERHCGEVLQTAVEVFAALRRWKDQFNPASVVV